VQRLEDEPYIEIEQCMGHPPTSTQTPILQPQFFIKTLILCLGNLWATLNGRPHKSNQLGVKF